MRLEEHQGKSSQIPRISGVCQSGRYPRRSRGAKANPRRRPGQPGGDGRDVGHPVANVAYPGVTAGPVNHRDAAPTRVEFEMVPVGGWRSWSEIRSANGRVWRWVVVYFGQLPDFRDAVQ